MVTIPTSYEAKEDGLNVLANISTYLPDYQFTVIGGHTKWMESHKDQTIRFLMSMIKAMRFINDTKNKEASIQAMVQHFKTVRQHGEKAYREVVEQIRPIRNDAAPSITGIEAVISLQPESQG